MKVLEIEGLTKHYEHFALDNVSFSLEKGRIMGFIGRNGAGKTTTLKSLMNFVHPDAGSVKFFGMDFIENEAEIKQRIGFASGGVDYYTNKKLRTITDVTRTFFTRWDDAAYRHYMELFKLEDSKTPNELSAGMKVKYLLTLALSHNAELLILDEPTSGLDPVSRDDLLDIFLSLADKGITILFSTHITSDLDKCADDITYIKQGRIIACENMEQFVSRYRVLTLTDEELGSIPANALIGTKRAKHGHSALITVSDTDRLGLAQKAENADLEAIMVHFEKEEE